MPTWFREDAQMMRFLQALSSIAVFNLLWLLCALPVVTIGASTTALYHCLFSMGRGESPDYRSFFRAFQESFGTATVSWLILLGVFAIGFFNLYVLDGESWVLLRALSGAVLIAGLITLPFLFPLISQFHMERKSTIRNAFLCGVQWLPRTLLMLALSALPLLGTFLLPDVFLYVGWVWIFFGFAGIAFICSKLMNPAMSFLKART